MRRGLLYNMTDAISQAASAMAKKRWAETPAKKKAAFFKKLSKAGNKARWPRKVDKST